MSISSTWQPARTAGCRSICRRVASSSPACSAMVGFCSSARTIRPRRSQLLIAPIDGPEPGLKLGEVYSTTYGWELSPDRAMVIFAAEQGPGLLILTETGAVEEAALGLPHAPSWQRLAP